MSYTVLILSLWIIGVNCRIQYDYSKKGVIGHDLSISNELKESLSVGWYGDIKYLSSKDTTLESSDDEEADKRDDETRDGGDPKPGTSSGGATSGTDGSDTKPGLVFLLFHLICLNTFVILGYCFLSTVMRAKRPNRKRTNSINSSLAQNCRFNINSLFYGN